MGMGRAGSERVSYVDMRKRLLLDIDMCSFYSLPVSLSEKSLKQGPPSDVFVIVPIIPN